MRLLLRRNGEEELISDDVDDNRHEGWKIAQARFDARPRNKNEKDKKIQSSTVLYVSGRLARIFEKLLNLQICIYK
jgi:hypothetical protein